MAGSSAGCSRRTPITMITKLVVIDQYSRYPAVYINPLVCLLTHPNIANKLLHLVSGASLVLLQLNSLASLLTS